MLASDGGAPAPRRLAARPPLICSPRTVGPQPHDVLRLALPLICSPRTVGPQPHDVLRLALPLVCAPRTGGARPHDVLRVALHRGDGARPAGGGAAVSRRGGRAR